MFVIEIEGKLFGPFSDKMVAMQWITFDYRRDQNPAGGWALRELQPPAPRDAARELWTTRESAADRTMLANGEIPAHLASPEKVDAEGFPITNRVELAYRMTGDLRRYADELHPGCEREVNLRVAADVIESLIEEYSEAKGEMANMREEYWRITSERDAAQAENRSLKQELKGHLEVFRERQAELERALAEAQVGT